MSEGFRKSNYYLSTNVYWEQNHNFLQKKREKVRSNSSLIVDDNAPLRYIYDTVSDNLLRFMESVDSRAFSRNFNEICCSGTPVRLIFSSMSGVKLKGDSGVSLYL